MEEALVSIVIPCHNAAEHLDACIMSALGQTYQNIEIVLVDDSSTDKTASIIHEFQNKSSKIKSFSVNFKSPSKTRNFAIRQSTGSYIATLDSDDLFTSDRIERLYNFIICDHSDFVFSNAYLFDGGMTFGLFSESLPCHHPALTIENFLRYIIIVHPMFLCKKSSIMHLGLYDESMIFLEDQELFIRALKNKLNLLSLDEPLYYCRVHQQSLSRSHKSDETLKWIETYRMYSQSPEFTQRQIKIAKKQIFCLWFRFFYFKYVSQIKSLQSLRQLKRLRKVL